MRNKHAGGGCVSVHRVRRKTHGAHAAQDAAELCTFANSLNRLRVSGFVLTTLS